MGSVVFLQIVTVIFALSIITTLMNKRIFSMPQAIGVPIVSAILVFILQWGVNLFGHNSFVHVDIEALRKAVRHVNFYDFLVNGVICFILTSSALKFKISDLHRYWRQIVILASLALLLCALFFGGLLYGYQYLFGEHVPLLILLLLGSALGATDPIGIKGVLNSVKAPRHLMVKLEGESLFNDAMCIVVFMTILKFLNGSHISVAGILENFFYEIIVAVLIGFVFGLMALRLLKGKHEMESLILTTALLASSSYLVSYFAHASGPIACVVGGLIVGNKWQEILQKQEIDEINNFWHAVEGIINSFLFTLIGLELFLVDISKTLFLGGIAAFVLLHLSRFAGNFLAFSFFPRVRRKSYHGSLTILSWGGVRGGISLALILAVANLPALQAYSDILIGYTFICVLLSGVVCGLGLPEVMNAYYHNPDEPKTGFRGWYQRQCHKFNRSGVMYTIEERQDGTEFISVYNPVAVATAAADAEHEVTLSPSEVQAKVDKLENPDNF
ncbi:sodium:proton antiporter [Snodgrassella sp. CFCC 13594]|uniref:cation:proton antiporter n=1 Tax=Snodgrassella sp. CFCC 13594 TaxID=1775559 RepID=UPI0008340DE2|nr:cation:proton antiporter [Snodgrassella sp. CFCC 13594]